MVIKGRHKVCGTIDHGVFERLLRQIEHNIDRPAKQRDINDVVTEAIKIWVHLSYVLPIMPVFDPPYETITERLDARLADAGIRDVDRKRMKKFFQEMRCLIDESRNW